MAEERKVGLSARGVSRMFDNEQAILVHFDRRPTDDELRDLHDRLRAAPSRAAPGEPEAYRLMLDFSEGSDGRALAEYARALRSALTAAQEALKEAQSNADASYDRAEAAEASALAAESRSAGLERLLRYSRDWVQVCANSVSPAYPQASGLVREIDLAISTALSAKGREGK